MKCMANKHQGANGTKTQCIDLPKMNSNIE